jgi:imidazolonepropionase-like amidohydrolase
VGGGSRRRHALTGLRCAAFRARSTVLAAALALAACSRPAPKPAAAPPEPSLAITHVTVVDVAAGRLVGGQTVVVRGERIMAAGDTARVAVPPNATLLDGRGKFLIPGLWDMHVHALFDAEVARAFLPAFVAYGVTGVRDMGGKVDVLRAARFAVLAGTLVGPRIVAAGAILDGPQPVDPSVSIAVGTPDQARAAVDSLAAHGADFIKVYTLLPRAAYFAVLREAARLRLPVGGHVPADVSTLEAADSGQRSVEHLRDEVEPLCKTVDAACGRLLDSLRAHHVWLVPTLVVLRAKAILDDSSLIQDPRLGTVPDLVRRAWDGIRAGKSGRPPAYWREKRTRFRGELALTGAAWKDGVPLLAGTDAGALYTYPGSSLHDELVQLVRAGLTPAAALRAATLGAAEFLGSTDSMGTVATGKVADLVLLDADPLADIRNTRSIRAVVLRGRLFGRGALDSLRTDATAAPAAPPGTDSGQGARRF